MSLECSGHGRISNLTCLCYDGWSGKDFSELYDDCQISESVWRWLHMGLLFTFWVLVARCLYVQCLLLACRCGYSHLNSANASRSRGSNRPRPDHRIACSLRTFHLFQLLFAIAGVARFSLSSFPNFTFPRGVVVGLTAALIASWMSCMGAIPGLFFATVQAQLGWASLSGGTLIRLESRSSEQACSAVTTACLLLFVWIAVPALHLVMIVLNSLESTLTLTLAFFVVSVGVGVCGWWGAYVVWILRSIGLLLEDPAYPASPQMRRNLGRVSRKLGCTLVLVCFIAVLLASPLVVFLTVTFFRKRTFLLVFPSLQVLALIALYLSFLFRPKSRKRKHKVTMMTDMTRASEGPGAAHTPLLWASTSDPILHRSSRRRGHGARAAPRASPRNTKRSGAASSSATTTAGMADFSSTSTSTNSRRVVERRRCSQTTEEGHPEFSDTEREAGGREGGDGAQGGEGGRKLQEPMPVPVPMTIDEDYIESLLEEAKARDIIT